MACGGSGSDAATATTPAQATSPATTSPATTVPATTAAPTTAATTTALPTTVPATTAAVTTSPVTTTPATTSPGRADLPVQVATADGFVTMSFPEGWQAHTVDAADRQVGRLAWSASEAIDELLAVEFGEAEILVARDALFVDNPGVAAFNRSLLDHLGTQPRFELNTSPLGSPGHQATAGVGNLSARLDTAEIDGQYLAVFTSGPSGDPVFEVLPAILESITVDVSVLDPLISSIDVEVAAVDAAGDEIFAVGVLAPATWEPDPGEDSLYLAPDGVNGISQHWRLADPGDTFESVAASVLDEALTAAWFDSEPDTADRVFNDVPYRIYFDGPAAGAASALVVGFDGVVFHGAMIRAGTADLLAAMVDSVWVTHSAINPP